MTDSQSAGKKGRHKLSSTLHTKHKRTSETWQLFGRTKAPSLPVVSAVWDRMQILLLKNLRL
jgi:hypothetical protein